MHWLCTINAEYACKTNGRAEAGRQEKDKCTSFGMQMTNINKVAKNKQTSAARSQAPKLLPE